LDYIVHMTRGSENVGTTTVRASSNVDAIGQAKDWAASLGLASDDDVLLWIKLQDGTFKTFGRTEF
jgi:hypothetical protein